MERCSGSGYRTVMSGEKGLVVAGILLAVVTLHIRGQGDMADAIEDADERFKS